MSTSNAIPNASLHVQNDKGGIDACHELGDKSTVKIGRSDGTDIQLKFSWVSRQHAMIQMEENGTFSVIDLGSSNGTFVNGRRIYTPVKLHSGDKIGIGQTTLVFIRDEEAECQPQQNGDDLEEKTVAFVNKVIVTVLICDIRRFTSLSETIGDSLLSKFLHAWSTKTSELIIRQDGVVDKFIGDAVMAMWTGGPSLSFSIHQALVAALKINAITKELSRKIEGIPWELKTGAAINTGQAILGSMGGNGRHDFTVIGDTINVAFRLEDMTGQAKLDLLMGGEAAKQLKNVDQYFKACKYFVKGKEEQVKAYGCTFEQLEQYLNKNK